MGSVRRASAAGTVVGARAYDLRGSVSIAKVGLRGRDRVGALLEPLRRVHQRASGADRHHRVPSMAFVAHHDAEVVGPTDDSIAHPEFAPADHEGARVTLAVEPARLRSLARRIGGQNRDSSLAAAG
jgi:hypothetical protein